MLIQCGSCHFRGFADSVTCPKCAAESVEIKKANGGSRKPDTCRKQLPKAGRSINSIMCSMPTNTSKEIWFAWYASYLLTDHWRKTRKNKMRATRGHCEMCGYSAEQIHHIHYRRLGRERNTDLIALCYKCHQIFHPHMQDAA